MNHKNSDQWLHDCISGHPAVDILSMLYLMDGEWKQERDWIGINLLWEELEFNSYTDYAIFNSYINLGGWNEKDRD